MMMMAISSKNVSCIRMMHKKRGVCLEYSTTQIFVYPSFLGAILINGPFCYEYGFRPLAFKPMMVAKNATT